MKTFKTKSKFGAKMKSKDNKLNSIIEFYSSRATRRKLERNNHKKVIKL